MVIVRPGREMYASDVIGSGSLGTLWRNMSP